MERLTWIPNEAFGISDEQAQEWAEAQSHGHWEHFTPEFVGVHAQTFDFKPAFEHMDQARQIYQEGRLSQPEGRVVFQTEHPITIFFLGDVHLGSIYCDHQTFFDQLRQISETPNAYIVWMSNLIDNAIPSQFPANMLVNALPPDKQVVAIRRIAEEMNQRGKVLGAVTSRCHEGWTYKHTGQDINALIFGFPDRHFPVLENGGRLYLQFPGRTLCAGLYHGVGPFESNFNETHALRQMNRLRMNGEGDILVGAHKHFAAAEVMYEGTGIHRKQVAYIRSGCFKGIGDLYDRYSVDNYASTGEPGGQSVTILPNSGMLDAHLDFEVGILAQQAYLAHHANG